MSGQRALAYEELFCLEGCGNYEQYYHMRGKFEEGACAFCNLDREINDVLVESDLAFGWAVPDQFSKKGLAHQLLVVPKPHVRSPWDLTDEERLALGHIERSLAGMFDLTGGMMFARFGDMSLNAGTVPHLHYNIWVPDGTREIRIPIFKDPGDREENRERAAGFAKRYEEGEVPE